MRLQKDSVGLPIILNADYVVLFRSRLLILIVNTFTNLQLFRSFYLCSVRSKGCNYRYPLRMIEVVL